MHPLGDAVVVVVTILSTIVHLASRVDKLPRAYSVCMRARMSDISTFNHAAASGNSALHSSVNWLWELRNRSIISHSFHARLRAEGSTPILKHHQAILDAIKAGEPEQARDAMHAHLQSVLDYILEH